MKIQAVSQTLANVEADAVVVIGFESGALADVDLATAGWAAEVR